MHGRNVTGRPADGKQIITPEEIRDQTRWAYGRAYTAIGCDSAATSHPTDDWVTQQGRNFLMQIEDSGEQITDVIHDWDTKYTQRFDALLKSESIRVHRVGPAKPNLNAHAERFVQTQDRLGGLLTHYYRKAA